MVTYEKRKRFVEVVKATDVFYDQAKRNPRLLILKIGKEDLAFASDLNVGDQIVIGAKAGKGVEGGEILKIENNLGNTVITLIEPKGVLWTSQFLKELRYPDQVLFLLGRSPYARELNRLIVELSFAQQLGIIPGRAYKPNSNDTYLPPIVLDDFKAVLDANGDRKVTADEAIYFVGEAKRKINNYGLTLQELSKNIPPTLKVAGIYLQEDLHGWLPQGSKVKNIDVTDGHIEETTHFNGILIKVVVYEKGKQFVYIKQQFPGRATAGITLNKYGDIDRSVQIEDLLTGWNFVNAQPLPNTVVNRGHGWPVTLSHYVSLIDKNSETVVVREEKIKSIKKVKKYCKCYYKLELEDSGLVSTVQPGKYQDCLAFITSTCPAASTCALHGRELEGHILQSRHS